MNLTEFVRQVSLEDFGREFRHRAEWNSRLQTTGGRFFPKDRHLDFNPKIYQAFAHHHLVWEFQLVLLETEYTFHDKCGQLSLVDVPLDMEEPLQWSCHQFPALPCLP